MIVQTKKLCPQCGRYMSIDGKEKDYTCQHCNYSCSVLDYEGIVKRVQEGNTGVSSLPMDERGNHYIPAQCCDKKLYSRGLCVNHYYLGKKYDYDMGKILAHIKEFNERKSKLGYKKSGIKSKAEKSGTIQMSIGNGMKLKLTIMIEQVR